MCIRDSEEGEDYEPEFLLPVCNSPRMGVCGYEGSDRYPDQFEPEDVYKRQSLINGFSEHKYII